MSEHRKARPETNEFILACDDLLTQDDAQIVRDAAMFYILDGWEQFWPFPQMPKWLQSRYWPADLVDRVKAAAEREAAR